MRLRVKAEIEGVLPPPRQGKQAAEFAIWLTIPGAFAGLVAGLIAGGPPVQVLGLAVLLGWGQFLMAFVGVWAVQRYLERTLPSDPSHGFLFLHSRALWLRIHQSTHPWPIQDLTVKTDPLQTSAQFGKECRRAPGEAYGRRATDAYSESTGRESDDPDARRGRCKRPYRIRRASLGFILELPGVRCQVLTEFLTARQKHRLNHLAAAGP